MLPEQTLKRAESTNQPLVSILMPVYNSMDFIRSEGFELLPKALDSLLNQTYKNFELLILDNQSTDITPKICKSYAIKDSRLKYFLDTQKRFPEGAINYLAALMQGKYCMVANDDDLWHPHYVRKMVEFLEQHRDLDMVYSNGNYITINNSVVGRIVRSKADAYSGLMSTLSNYCAYILKRNVIPIAFGLFKSEIYRRILPFEAFDKLKSDVDNLFMAKFFLLGYKCHYVEEELFFYRAKSRPLDLSKIPGAPGLDKPLLLWMYYVRHQLYFFRKLDDIVRRLGLSESQYFYVRCVTFHSFIAHSRDLLRWVKNDLAIVREKVDIDTHVKLSSFVDQVLMPSLLWPAEVGLFQEDTNDNVRFQPAVVAPLLDLTWKKCLAFGDLIKYYNSLVGAKETSEIVRELEELLRGEISVFQKEKVLVESEIGKVPEILTRKDVNEHVEINDKRPILSVITYSMNQGRFLEETIVSMLGQSFRDFEHIVIDRGSSDEALRVLKRYPQIKCISEKNASHLAVLRKGLAIAKGKYVTQCTASGGYIDSGWFQKCVQALDSDLEFSLVWGFPQQLTEDGKLGDIPYPQFHYRPPPKKHEWFLYWLLSGFVIPEGSFCVRKEVLDKCLPSINGRSIGLDPHLEFNYNFNSLGYLPCHIPTVVNYSRISSNRLGRRERSGGVEREQWQTYQRKVTYYRWQLLTRIAIHTFRNGAHEVLSVKFSAKEILHSYIIRFMPERVKHFVKKILPYFTK